MSATTSDRAPRGRAAWLRKSDGGNRSAFSAASLVLALGFAVLALYPICLVLGQLFFEGGRVDTALLARIVREPDLWVLLRNTALLSQRVAVAGAKLG